jgi:hypothetical protein
VKLFTLHKEALLRPATRETSTHEDVVSLGGLYRVANYYYDYYYYYYLKKLRMCIERAFGAVRSTIVTGVACYLEDTKPLFLSDV